MAITISGSGITSANIADGTIVNADINSSAAIDGSKVSGSFGKVLQVVQTVKTDSTSTSSATAVSITGLSVSITPSSSSSKILITASVYIGHTNGQRRQELYLTGGGSAAYKGDVNSTLKRAASAACNRTADAYGMHGHTLSYLDSPATTSAITYQVQWSTEGATMYLNRPGTIDANGSSTASTITVMEIGA
jgi:hypothetical protein